jgi:hypothetical protein
MLFNIRQAASETATSSFDDAGRGLQALSTTGLFRFEFPAFRYEVWDVKDVAAKTYATALGYDKDSWNYVVLNEVENLCYEALVPASPGQVTTPTAWQSAATNMGFTEDVWDCFIK